MLFNTTSLPERPAVPPQIDLAAGLANGQNHPSIHLAKSWLARQDMDLVVYGLRGLLIQLAAGGDENARLCLGTLERLLSGQPVSDRYFLALCWTLRTLIDDMGRMGYEISDSAGA